MNTYRKVTLLIAGLFIWVPVGWPQTADEVKRPIAIEKKIDVPLERMTKRLHLTEEQEKQIEAIFEKNTVEIAALQTQIRALREQMKKEVDTVLTDEQKAKMPIFPPEPRGPQGRPSKGGREGLGRGHGFGAPAPHEFSGVRGSRDFMKEPRDRNREIRESRPGRSQERFAERPPRESNDKRDELDKPMKHPRDSSRPSLGPRKPMRFAEAQEMKRGAGFRGLLRCLDLSDKQKAQIREILTPDQIEELNEFKSDISERGRRGGEPGANAMNEHRRGYRGGRNEMQ